MIFKSFRFFLFLVLLCIDKVIFFGEDDILFFFILLIIVFFRLRLLIIKRLNFKMVMVGILEIYCNVLGSDLF